MLPQDRVSALTTNGSRTAVDSTQNTPSLPFISPLPHHDSFTHGLSALNRSGSLSSRSDISLASESSFSSYTHDPHKKPKKNILRKPSDRHVSRAQKKSVTWKNEPTVSYIEAEDDSLSVCSSECSYLPPTNPYWLASNHMGRWRDEDGREMLLHQRWMADNKWHSRNPHGYPVLAAHGMKMAGPLQGSVNIAAVRRPFIDEEPLPAINPLNRVNPVMMAPPPHFPDDDMSDLGSETGSEVSLEAKLKAEDKQSTAQQASIGNGHPVMTETSESGIRKSTAKETSPQVSTPMKPGTHDARENSLPLSPVKINDAEVSMMDDTALDVQKDLGFKFPAHTGVSASVGPLEKLATDPPKPNLQLEASTAKDANAVQQIGTSSQKDNGLSPSPTGEEDVPIPAVSKLAEAVVRRDNEQKMKIMAARLKRASLEMAETIYISGVSKDQLQAQMQAQQLNGLAETPSSPSADEQASTKQEEPVNLTASTTNTTSKKEPQADGAKKKKDTFGILNRFGLSKLGKGKVVPRSKNDPLPSVPLLDALPDLTGESHYTEVDASLREAILGGGNTQSPVSVTAPYASIDRLQLAMRQQQHPGLLLQAQLLPPPPVLDHATIMQQIASTGSHQQFSLPVVHTRSSSDTTVLLNHGQDAVQPQCTLTSTGLKLTTKPVSHTTSLVTIPGGNTGQAAGNASQVGVVQVCHCEAVSSDAMCGVAGKLQPAAPRQSDPSVQNGVAVPQVPHEMQSLLPSKATIATSLELERATNGVAKRLPPQESAKLGAQTTTSGGTNLSRPPPTQSNHTGIATGRDQRAASFHTEAIPAPPGNFKMVHATSVDHGAVESGMGRKLVPGNLDPQRQRGGPASSLLSAEVRNLQKLALSEPVGQGEATETGGGSDGKTGTGAVASKPPVPPKKLSMSSMPTMMPNGTLAQQNGPAANSGSLSGAPETKRITSSATNLQSAAGDMPPLPPRRHTSLKQPEGQLQQQQPFVSQSTERRAVSEHASQPSPSSVVEERAVKAEAAVQDKPPLKEKPVVKPKARPDPVQSAPSLPQEAEKVKPPVKPKPPPVMFKPVQNSQLPSKPEPPSSTSTHQIRGQEATKFPLPACPVPPVQQQGGSNPPPASAPQEQTDGPAGQDLLYDKLSDYWDIPQKVAAEAEGTVNDQKNSKSQIPETAVAAPTSQTTSSTSQPAATGPLQEEAEPVLRPYQKTGFYNSLSSISPSPSPTPSLVLSGNNFVPSGPPHSPLTWSATASPRSSQEPPNASTASQAKPNAAKGKGKESIDGNSRSNQASLPAASSQNSSSSSSSSSAKETQSIFLRKMLASSDQSIVPHHMLMVEEASKGRVTSPTSARQVPAEEPSPTSIDTELEDLINELQDEAEAILRSQQTAAPDVLQECGE